uniref:TPT domain-containing protein n=1 Tax=Rhabditophanes sp. KR3021 TaxID=114890 RepID=A0AC35TL26_9BILA
MLTSYPYPLTVALNSLFNNMCYATFWVCITKASAITALKRIPIKYTLTWLVPLGFGKALAAASTYFGLLKVTISYAQTVKCTMPIFTVIIARIFLKERQPKSVYFSLVPIIAGVLLCTMTEFNFDLQGLTASLVSTSLYSFMNVLAKKILDDTNITPLQLLSLNSKMALCLFFPIWFYNEGSILLDQTAMESPEFVSPDSHFLLLMFASGFISFCQNFCAFTLINHLTALSYSVANTSKRIIVIGSSIFFFHNNVTVLNLLGITFAILGVVMYNRLKHIRRTHKNYTLLKPELEKPSSIYVSGGFNK